MEINKQPIKMPTVPEDAKLHSEDELITREEFETRLKKIYDELYDLRMKLGNQI